MNGASRRAASIAVSLGEPSLSGERIKFGGMDQGRKNIMLRAPDDRAAIWMSLSDAASAGGRRP
jgi:hypothetical protein